VSLPVAFGITQRLALSRAIFSSLALSAAEGAPEHPESRTTIPIDSAHKLFIFTVSSGLFKDLTRIS